MYIIFQALTIQHYNSTFVGTSIHFLLEWEYLQIKLMYTWQHVLDHYSSRKTPHPAHFFYKTLHFFFNQKQKKVYIQYLKVMQYLTF